MSAFTNGNKKFLQLTSLFEVTCCPNQVFRCSWLQHV